MRHPHARLGQLGQLGQFGQFAQLDRPGHPGSSGTSGHSGGMPAGRRSTESMASGLGTHLAALT